MCILKICHKKLCHKKLCEFREKILEHKQNIESRPESDEVDVGGDEQGLDSNEVEDIDSLR